MDPRPDFVHQTWLWPWVWACGRGGHRGSLLKAASNTNSNRTTDATIVVPIALPGRAMALPGTRYPGTKRGICTAQVSPFSANGNCDTDSHFAL
eukprot:2631667-Rhodomonas_salina.2